MQILQIPLEISGSPLGTPEYLMSRCVRYLASAGKQSQRKSLGSVAGSKIWLQPIFLKLLIVWLADCRAAVSSFLEAPAHLPYMVELLNTADSPVSVHVSGLAAVLLGECVLYNTSIESFGSHSKMCNYKSYALFLILPWHMHIIVNAYKEKFLN